MKGELRVLRALKVGQRSLQPSPMGEDGVHEAQTRGGNLPRMRSQVSNGRKWALHSKTDKMPHSAGILLIEHLLELEF